MHVGREFLRGYGPRAGRSTVFVLGRRTDERREYPRDLAMAKHCSG
jgi:hypothetical protein